MIPKTMKSAEWFTPQEWAERCRHALGTIDIDVASCPEANETIKATTYYTTYQDGLAPTWPKEAKIFCNPPGGKRAGKSLPRLFLEKIESFYKEGGTAIFLAYNVEHLRWATCPVLIALPRKRIAFSGQGSPVHGNAFLLYSDDATVRNRFFSAFEDCLILGKQ